MPESGGLEESTEIRVSSATDNRPSTVMVMYPLVGKGERMEDQCKQNETHIDDVNERHGEFCTWLANKACDSDAFEALQAMDEGVENRFINEQRERKVLSDVDLGRIAPRFSQLGRARKAVASELLELLHIRQGSTALELVTTSDKRWKSNKRLHTMIVIRKKTNAEFTPRLVIRGDTHAKEEVECSSAPTAFRGSIQTAISLATLCGLQVSVLDVSQAFLQSDEPSGGDKVYVAVPPFVTLPKS